MIKKTLGLFIIGLSFFNFSNAIIQHEIGITNDFQSKIIDTSFNLLYNGEYKAFYWGNSYYDTKFRRESDGMHYTQKPRKKTYTNGIINGYFTCNGISELISSNNTPNPLSYYSSICEYNEGYEGFGNYLNTYNFNYYLEGTQAGSSINPNRSQLCLYDSTEDFGLCIDTSYTTELGQSQIDLSYIENNAINNPFIGGNGNNQSGTTVIRTGKNYYCPTYGELMKYYGINYNTGLCYNGTMRYLNGSITTVQQQDIFTVFNNDFDNFKQRIKVYNNNCIAPATQTQCENAFNGEREKYSIIANAIHNNVDDIGLWNYCNIAQQDPNISTCVANPGEIHKENPTPEELIDYIERIGDIGIIMTPTTGNILEDLLEDGQTRDDIATRDIFGQLDQIKNKIGGIFEKRTGIDGIIPDYILWLILVSLLLTVLLKK